MPFKGTLKNGRSGSWVASIVLFAGLGLRISSSIRFLGSHLEYVISIGFDNYPRSRVTLPLRPFNITRKGCWLFDKHTSSNQHLPTEYLLKYLIILCLTHLYGIDERPRWSSCMVLSSMVVVVIASRSLDRNEGVRLL